ncbi:hypothetical protein [Acuticoccus mangrovi]|uniref:Uncharacterized protein n=1 Tax=Acuticoccus mangrovi TaxID=2796142 RepID=A0A934IU69_9HYPH|nr:hypothetical protein [Acuticoccus mangrovi]MBJ3778673.1 hypothetical protein [Acuticoccus mangrovi]
MISSIIDFVLLSALAATSGCVLLMYRRLQRFDALQGVAAKEFARSSEALDRAREAIQDLQADGGDMAVALASRLNEARVVMNDIDQATTRTMETFLASPAAAMPATSEPAPLAPDAPASPPRAEAPGAEAPARSPASSATTVAERIRKAARVGAERPRAGEQTPAQPPRAQDPAGAPPQPMPPRIQDAGFPRIHRTPEGDAATPAFVATTPIGGDARRSATARYAKPTPTGPVMMVVKPSSDTTESEEGNESALPAAARSAPWTPPKPATVSRANGRENAPASRSLTWSELAKAAHNAG